MSEYLLFLLLVTILYIYLYSIRKGYMDFQRQRNQLKWRVHVNGIRGKSTVTRYVAAIFREANYHTFAKTTGSAARIINSQGKDISYRIKGGYPNVNEQPKILKQFLKQEAEVVVMECMAVNPLYAKWLEEKVIKSNLGIITNVRIDHTDYMGDTLEKIAHSLSKTIPQEGILITAERRWDPNPDDNPLRVLTQNANRKKTRIIQISQSDIDDISKSDLLGFDHIAIPDNVAIGYKVAEILGIPKKQALEAMQKAPADPGAIKIQTINFQQYKIVWANLFAVNDKESFIDLCRDLLFKQYPQHHKVVILNNRADRPERVKRFAHLAIELQFDRVITFGDYEAEVRGELANTNIPVGYFGNSSNFHKPQGKKLLEQITLNINNKEILLIGAVNIHTDQATELLTWLEKYHASHENNLQQHF